MTIDAHKMGDGEVRDPRMLTTYVSAQLMRKVEQIVRRDTYADIIELLHEIHTRDGTPRLGFYRVCMMAKRRDDVVRNSHIFDLQMCMDLRDGWEAYVEKKTLEMISALIEEYTT